MIYAMNENIYQLNYKNAIQNDHSPHFYRIREEGGSAPHHSFENR